MKKQMYSHTWWQFGLLTLVFLTFFDVKVTPRFIYNTKISESTPSTVAGVSNKEINDIDEKSVLPEKGVSIPLEWGNFGIQLVQNGVIDREKIEEIYKKRGGLGEYELQLLDGKDTKTLLITKENAGFMLNMLWAFGLGNKNAILESELMMDPKNPKKVASFASTGGWTLMEGDILDHYDKHELVKLTAEQQALVKKVADGIYRPCCGNPTSFPDCNHGMAMLGLLELLAANGYQEKAMFKTALAVNSYWFPDTYLTLARYFASQGISWDKVDPKIALSSKFSSAKGYKRILSEVEPVQKGGGGGCSV